MDAGIVATRYAKAIYEFALEKDDEKVVYEGFETLIGSFYQLPQLRTALKDPTVSAEQKFEVLLTACGGGKNATLKDILRMILKNGRVAYLSNIALSYRKHYRKAKGLVIAHLTTVEPANEKTKKELIAVLSEITDHQVEFHTYIDPELIGGFVLEIEDRRLDASVKDQLNRLRLDLKLTT